MLNRLELFEFIKYDILLDNLIYENFETQDPNDRRWHAREQDAQNKLQIVPTEDMSTQIEDAKQELVSFIVGQLDNVRMSRQTLSLKELTIKNNKNFTDTISNAGLKPLFYMLCSGVNAWLKGYANQRAIQELLKPIQGKITDLVHLVAPLVSEKLKEDGR